MGEIWRGFLDLIFGILYFVYSFVGDWGLSIIVVTILFRILIWPLMVKQVRSMRSMQKIQPLIKEVQKKYADDKEKQSQEMMRLYQEHKVNPMAGCLPMLLPMPLFIGFFAVLMMPRINDEGIVELAVAWYGKSPLLEHLGYVIGAPIESLDVGTASFFNILPNLMVTPGMMWEVGPAAAAPYIILLILSSVGIILPSFMTQRGIESSPQATQQKFIIYSMAIFMAFIGWGFFPGGVLLYMTTTSLFAAGQQYFVQRQMDREEESAAEEARAEKKNKKKKNKNADANKKK